MNMIKSLQIALLADEFACEKELQCLREFEGDWL